MFISWFEFNMYISLQLTDGINRQQILENNCGRDSPQLRRSLSDGKRAVTVRFGDTLLDSLPALKCRVWLPPYIIITINFGSSKFMNNQIGWNRSKPVGAKMMIAVTSLHQLVFPNYFSDMHTKQRCILLMNPRLSSACNHQLFADQDYCHQNNNQCDDTQIQIYIRYSTICV